MEHVVEISVQTWASYTLDFDSYNEAITFANNIINEKFIRYTDDDWDTTFIYTDKIVDICIMPDDKYIWWIKIMWYIVWWFIILLILAWLIALWYEIFLFYYK